MEENIPYSGFYFKLGDLANWVRIANFKIAINNCLEHVIWGGGRDRQVKSSPIYMVGVKQKLFVQYGLVGLLDLFECVTPSLLLP